MFFPSLCCADFLNVSNPFFFFVLIWQGPYIRTRENPYFDGLLVKGGSLTEETSNSDFGSLYDALKVSRSRSDIGDSVRKNLGLKISEKPMEPAFGDSVSDAILQPFIRASNDSWSNAVRQPASVLSDIQSESNFHLDNPSDSIKDSLDHYVPSLLGTEKSYKVMKKRISLPKIPLPQSAASFYNGYSPRMEIVESCESINRLNLFLKSRREEVDAGVPGRFLHAVIGQDVPGNYMLSSLTIIIIEVLKSYLLFLLCL